MHQTIFPPVSGVAPQSHRWLSASTRTSPRPVSSSPASMGTGGCELASHTRIRTWARSESRRSRTGNICSRDWDACTALVTSSETSSSTSSRSAVSPHSHSTCRACSRAQGTAPGSAPSSRKLCNGQLSAMPCPRCGGEGKTGTAVPLDQAGGLPRRPGTALASSAPRCARRPGRPPQAGPVVGCMEASLQRGPRGWPTLVISHSRTTCLAARA